MDALRDGKIQAAIFVGAAPLPNIQVLKDDDFKLLQIGEDVAARVKSVYRPTKLTYVNLKASRVPTIAPIATILTREYKTVKLRTAQTKFRQCFDANLDELKETPGYYTKWQMVDPNDHGLWGWLDLPK